jgi:deoxyribonuclease (pyrimidine dimer)
MTRINVVAPQYLADNHLMAEYRELPMIVGSLRRTLKSPKGIGKIPKDYTLGKGHVTFFYDKGAFLHRRYNDIVTELVNRDYKLNEARVAEFDTFICNGLFNDWVPNGDDLIVNIDRIHQRILMKPHWYRYYGVSLTNLDCMLYNTIIYPQFLYI